MIQVLNYIKCRGRILLAEDEPEQQQAVSGYLEGEGYEVVVADTGPRVLDLMDRAELLVLDLGLPGLEGMEVLRRLRTQSKIPVLILSARSGGRERVQGLKTGADDYLVKPFLPEELSARVEALFRRSRLPPTSHRTTGPLVFDDEARQASLFGEPVKLSPKEYELLRTLARTPSKTFTREELLERVWGPEHWDSRRVDLYVSKIRAKIRRPGLPSLIHSVWGVGYRYICK